MSNEQATPQASPSKKILLGAAGVVAVGAGAALTYYLCSKDKNLAFLHPTTALMYPTVPNWDFKEPLKQFVELYENMMEADRLTMQMGGSDEQRAMGRVLVENFSKKVIAGKQMPKVLAAMDKLTEQSQGIFKMVMSYLMHGYRNACKGRKQKGKIVIPKAITLPLEWLCDRLKITSTITLFDLSLGGWRHPKLEPDSKWTFEQFVEVYGEMDYKLYATHLHEEEAKFNKLFLLAEIYGTKIYPHMFGIYAKIKNKKTSSAGASLSEMAKWFRKLNNHIKRVWNLRAISKECFEQVSQAISWEDGGAQLGVSGFQVPLFQMINMFLSITPPDKLRQQMLLNSTNAFSPRYQKAMSYIQLRRGNLQDFITANKKKKDLVDGYNSLVREVVSFRAMHRARGSVYFELPADSVGSSRATTTTGLSREQFQHDMDMIIEATKSIKHTGKMKKMAGRGRLANVNAKKNESVLIGKSKNKKIDTHHLRMARMSIL